MSTTKTTDVKVPTAKEKAALAKAAQAETAKRAALAKKIIALRQGKTPWDGPEGICAKLGIKGAPEARKIMRELGHGDQIAASYDRQAAKDKREAAKS
jgi:hypothetical protein